MNETEQGRASTGYAVTLTAAAAQAVREAFQEQGVAPESAHLRVGARTGGCSGYMYELDYAAPEEVGEADVVFETQGLRVAVNRECLETLLGSTEIDYQRGNLVEQGFRFQRKSDGAVCGCGESFTPLQPRGPAASPARG